jgi:hypothetical protein
MRSRALLLAFTVLTATSFAFAQEPRHEPSPADVHTARLALTEGLALREKGDQLGALGRLQTAFDLVATPITAFELGKTHMMLGHVLQAYELFNRVTRMEPRTDESARAKSSRMEAARLSSELEPRIPKLRIKVKLVEKDAVCSIRIDEETITTKGEETLRAVDPGEHKIVAKAGDGPEQIVKVTVAESETKDVELAPKWVAPQPKPEGNVFYAKRTNPLTLVGFSTAGAGLLLLNLSIPFYVSAEADLADKCGNDYCPPSTIGNERQDATLWGLTTIIGGAATFTGVCVGVYGLMNPVKEKFTTGSTFRFGPGSVEWRGTF